ncbi:MAG: radical SAM protein [Spirochaetia bacterium]
MKVYQDCRLCGRNCGVNREAGEIGICGETGEMRIALASIHHGEEPVLTGEGGSGTVFFSGCSLRCYFCQNHQVSQEGVGKTASPEDLAEICIALQKNGASNINLVTGTHFIPSIAEGLEIARNKGLTLPVLWNSSGYEKPEYLSLLSEVTVFLPDLKTLDPKLSEGIFHAPDYPEFAAACVKWMAENRSIQYSDSLLQQGLIVRHLVLPGQLESTRGMLQWFSKNCKGKALLSLMVQYTPMERDRRKPELVPDSRIDFIEYDRIIGLLEEYDIEDGFVQELDVEDTWLPDFCQENPFPSSMSRVVWSWQKGFV